MSNVSIRDLRNQVGEVVERAQRGERVTITRAGKPVAQLTALGRTPLSLVELRKRRDRLPAVDPVALRRDVAGVADDSL